MKLNTNKHSYDTENLNQAVENSKKQKSNTGILRLIALLLSTIAVTSLIGCTELKGKNADEVSIDTISSDTTLKMTDDTLYANIGEIKTGANGSRQELFILTPENCVDYAIYNEKDWSVSEMISYFKGYLSDDSKSSTALYQNVTNGKAVKNSDNQLTYNSEDETYTIFENSYLLRYNYAETTLSVFDLEREFEFTDLEQEKAPYVSLPETRSKAYSEISYESIDLPKLKVKN